MAEFKKMFTGAEITAVARKALLNLPNITGTIFSFDEGPYIEYDGGDNSLALYNFLYITTNGYIKLPDSVFETEISAGNYWARRTDTSFEIYLSAEEELARITKDSNDIVKITKDNISINVNPRQPSIEYEGDITENAGSGAKYGTYTLKYVPLLDSNGNVVGGAGTIALNFTEAASATTLYLTNANTLPNLTGVVKATTGAISMICIEGASGDASMLTLQGGLAGAIVPTTLEGGINIYSN